MIEKIILDYLNRCITESALGIKAYMERPANKPSSYVLIEKTGGGEDNHIKHSTLAIQSIGKTLYDAASLNESIKDFMRGAISLNEVAKVEINSDYNYTDTSTKEYRYQAVFDLTHY